MHESENIGRFSIKQVYNDHCATDHRANEVLGYSDADCARPGRKSTSGDVFMINGGAASWKSQTQLMVALIAAETECIAASEAAKGALYPHKLMAEMRHEEPATITLLQDTVLLRLGLETRLITGRLITLILDITTFEIM